MHDSCISLLSNVLVVGPVPQITRGNRENSEYESARERTRSQEPVDGPGQYTAVIHEHKP